MWFRCQPHCTQRSAQTVEIGTAPGSTQISLLPALNSLIHPTCVAGSFTLAILYCLPMSLFTQGMSLDLKALFGSTRVTTRPAKRYSQLLASDSFTLHISLQIPFNCPSFNMISLLHWSVVPTDGVGGTGLVCAAWYTPQVSLPLQMAISALLIVQSTDLGHYSDCLVHGWW